MSTRAITPKPPADIGHEVPPLESGDHLTRDEFERRYDATSGVKKAELIDGVVYMPPPAVRWDYHGTPHIILATWIGTALQKGLASPEHAAFVARLRAAGAE
ncbi:MAG TPA: hypothetical protein VGI81_08215 [Tepidisphaeraceae bacterium]|jgi:hypothetical protein